MDLLLPIAVKSFFVAGMVLLLLKIAQKRSASDRSWIAHLGLLAVLLLPVAAVTLPALNVEGPSFLAGPAPEAAAPAEPLAQASTTPVSKAEAASPAGTFPAESGAALAARPVDWAVWAYAAPAGLLLLLTLIALCRLIGLKGRATVMVEPNWLTALARAQRRMGFKHGTALLTSDELPSPISWGVVRPVILLNGEAAQSHAEAEAIIAHELAHVASLDWAKLLLSRITVALFWFNPLVWVLAREAHQLREEAADDAVLGADIEDTEYARLLVGVARHECRGLLIGAHGVAPAKNSLARRIRRVLDGALERAPGGWRWSTAAAFFAAGMAVPVAALNFVPAASANAAAATDRVSGANAALAGNSREAQGVVPQAAVEVAAAAAVEAAQELDRSALAAIAAAEAAADVSDAIEGDTGDHEGASGPMAVGGVVQAGEPVEAISITGGGQVLVRYGRNHQVRIVRGDEANVSVSDGSLSVHCTRHCGNVVVEVTTPRFEALAVQGGGTIRVAERFPRMPDLALATHGGGRIDARLAPATTVAAVTRGGGTILTTADGDLAASTSGGGEIRYWGTTNVATAIQGGGRISPGD